MPRPRARRVVEELTRDQHIDRYEHIAEMLGLKKWEIEASTKWLQKQSRTFCSRVADKAEQVVEDTPITRLRSMIDSLTRDD